MEQEFKPAYPGCGETMAPHQIRKSGSTAARLSRRVAGSGEMSALRATQMLIRGNLNLFIRLGQ